MTGDPSRNRRNVGFAVQINRYAPCLLQRLPVQLEPARLTASRKPAIGDHDVGIGAGAGETNPIDSVSAADGQHPPGSAAAHDVGNAGVIASPGKALLFQV